MSDKFDQYKDQLIIGIDLGTTKSGVAAWRPAQGKVEMLPTNGGKSIMPSVVGWDNSQQQWVVGQAAKLLAERKPTAVAYSVKRFIGRWFKDPAVLYGHRDLNYKLEAGDGQDQLRDVMIHFGFDEAGKPIRLSAPEVSSKVLAQLRQDAATALALPLEDVRYAVITVPAYFNVLQRRATILAGKLAGLEVVDILNEPTAAALAYRDLILDTDKEQRVLVYDLGGGTFDISLLEVSQDDAGYLFYTRVVDGDTRLGGDDIDNTVVRWLSHELEKQYGHKVRTDDLVTRERLRHAAEAAKVALSAQETYRIALPQLDLGSRVPFDAQVEITRTQLEACAAPLIERARTITARAVEKIAQLTWKEIDEVILVGGQTLMPAVQRSIAELTGHKPRVLDRPQEAVTLGAGEYAYILSRGAEKFTENALINVISLPLGIHLPNEEPSFRPLAPANSQLPLRSQPYRITTTEDNQRQIDVEILQGHQYDTTNASDCERLGTLSMEIMPAPKRVPKFQVELDVQSDGTLQVIVTDLRGNQSPKTLDIVETSVTVWRDQTKAQVGQGV